MRAGARTVDEYIESFPKEERKALREIRGVIRKSAPDATEKISYQIPAYSQNGVLVYFASFKDHYSLFGGREAIRKFKKELSNYGTSTGTIRFRKDKPVPKSLIAKIVKFRLRANLEKKKSR
jgi:uncharacterized protein YdhG (YjbR/CyaY superfamily)